MVAGRYSLVREVGRGGMGSVWLARDKVLQREVAIKRLGHGGFDVARAAREARLAASLNHPHVVAVFDLVDEGDERWLVMEYVAGRTLSALAAEAGPLPVAQVAHLLGQAAEALAAAHASGVIHRDVKPSNMLVTSDGTLKLTDFGIARALGDATMTQTGMVTGSPAYLSPEIARGDRATPAGDVWSLGATAFHALTGRPPYESDGGPLATLYQVVHHEPPTLPADHPLAPLLRHTMVTDPGSRWSMAQVHRFLVGPERAVALQDTATAVVPPAPVPAEATRQLTRTDRRRPRVLGVAVAVAALVGLSAAAWALTQRGHGGERNEGSPAAGSSAADPSADASPSGPEAGPTAARMQEFLIAYLDAATSDQRAGWEMLTPAFRVASGGFGDYQRFWRQQTSAEVTSFVADPERLRVEYDVRYDQAAGGVVDDHVVLDLVYEDGVYLIDGES